MYEPRSLALLGDGDDCNFRLLDYVEVWEECGLLLKGT